VELLRKDCQKNRNHQGRAGSVVGLDRRETPKQALHIALLQQNLQPCPPLHEGWGQVVQLHRGNVGGSDGLGKDGWAHSQDQGEGFPAGLSSPSG
jgi:hypothetical protein